MNCFNKKKSAHYMWSKTDMMKIDVLTTLSKIHN